MQEEPVAVTPDPFSLACSFFLNQFPIQNTPATQKAVLSPAYATQVCVSCCPFPGPPLFCPQTANNLFFTVTQGGERLPSGHMELLHEQIGYLWGPEAQRRRWRYSKGITLKLNSPDPKCHGHNYTSFKTHCPSPASRISPPSSKGACSRAQGGCFQPLQQHQSGTSKSCLSLKGFPPHPEFCTNRR